jgi:hypothetical protein
MSLEQGDPAPRLVQGASRAELLLEGECEENAMKKSSVKRKLSLNRETLKNIGEAPAPMPGGAVVAVTEPLLTCSCSCRTDCLW